MDEEQLLDAAEPSKSRAECWVFAGKAEPSPGAAWKSGVIHHPLEYKVGVKRVAAVPVEKQDEKVQKVMDGVFLHFGNC